MRMPLVAAQVVYEAVVGHSIQVGRELRGWPITIRRLDYLAPNFLENVVGVLRMPAQSEQVSIQGIIVPPIEDLKRGSVAVFVTQH